MKTSALVRWIVLSLAILASVSLAMAQGGATASIRGTVTDPSGAVIPAASVSATNNATGVTRSTTTAADGQYAITGLPVGAYNVTTTAKGFQTQTSQNLTLTVDQTARLDFKLSVGQAAQAVTVESAAPLVNTEEGRTSTLIDTSRVENLPLNGRNVYDLMQFTAGSIDTRGTDFEGGAGVSVNGTRVNFTGFDIDGVSNKMLSGGFTNQPPIDSVQEMRIETTNFSAQYGQSAGAITELATRQGGNNWHGDIFEYVRNQKLDANNYFHKLSQAQAGQPNKQDPFKFNQFGAALGGPIIKDKTFFYAVYQGSTLRAGTNIVQTYESPQFVNLVASTFNSALGTTMAPTIGLWLMQNYKPPAGGTVAQTFGSYLGYDPKTNTVCNGGSAACDYPGLVGDPNANVNAAATRANALFNAMCGGNCNTPNVPFLNTPILLSQTVFAPTRSIGNFNEGNTFTLRVDHNINSNNRLFFSGLFNHSVNPFLGGSVGFRGFVSPNRITTAYDNVGWSSTITPTLINEARVGYTRSFNTIAPAIPGVPEIYADDGALGWGSYNGYPQTFIENQGSVTDMVSWTKGPHLMKFGGELRRNWENSDFNVGRPSYEFEDSIWLASDGPYSQAAGVNPDIVTSIGSLNPGYKPISQRNAHLSSNYRNWRNWDTGEFFEDDWKVTPRLTLNLGIRYDLYTRHTEAANQVTGFVIPAGGLPAITDPLFGENGSLGGFRVSPNGHLGTGDHNNFAPRLGFAWDPTGSGNMAVRGGFGVAYESTFYNAESNSRWNLPFYSFNDALNDIFGDVSNIIYGVRDASGNLTQAPSASSGSNIGGGFGPAFVGNIMGWDPTNANTAILTGIFPPEARDPYVYSGFFGIQKQLPGQSVFNVQWVVTSGHKLFRAENTNRVDGDRCGKKTKTKTYYCAPGSEAVTIGVATEPVTDPTTGAFLGYKDPRGSGRQGLVVWPAGNPYTLAFPNVPGFMPGSPIFGRLRVWQNTVNSIYNGLQVEFSKRMTHGLLASLNYTWSHNIDEGSTWHSGATTSNGPARGEGFTEDVLLPGLERGNSLLDNRHRLTASWTYELPWFTSQNGVVGHVLGGWRYSGGFSGQTGSPFTVYCSSTFPTCDWNADGTRNDAPDNPGIAVPRQGTGPHSFLNSGLFGAVGGPAAFPSPCLGCDGTSPRNGFRGPGILDTDMSLAKNIKWTERVSSQLRVDAFNIFNRLNLSNPVNDLSNKSQFGQSTSLDIQMRQIQLGLRIQF